jgi:DNA-binding protein
MPQPEKKPARTTISIILGESMAENQNEQSTSSSKGADNIIYIGKKPLMNYVLAVVTQLNNGASEVIVKARGNSISKAVDVADIVRKRFVTSIKDPSNGNINIGSEELANEDGTKSKVSFIQISASCASPQSAQQQSQHSEDKTIYIGKKPTMNYVLAMVTQINSGLQTVVVKARGNSISKAVDVVEIARHRFIPALKDPSGGGITIKSEEVANEDGTKSKVSSMQISIKN